MVGHLDVESGDGWEQEFLEEKTNKERMI